MTKYTPQEMDRLIAEFREHLRNEKPEVETAGQLTVAELCDAYLEHCETYYQRIEHRVLIAIKLLRDHYANLRGSDFTAKMLKQLREVMLSADRVPARTYVNGIVSEIKRLFRWAASEEFVAHDVPAKLATVAGLHKNRSKARENPGIKPVAVDVVLKTVLCMQRIPADMVRIQLLTGARPGEIRKMRPMDIDRTKSTWIYKPESHKTAWRGRERFIPLGPMAQEILRHYLRGRAPAAYCFSPREVMEEIYESKRQSRLTPLQPSQFDRKRGRLKNESYNRDSYRQSIIRGCRKAKVAIWSPNQLRHTAATIIRQKYGLEAAQSVLGHSRADVTQIYAEVNLEKAVAIMQEIG